MDTMAMREAVAQRPHLIHWVARTDDIDAARRASPIDLGPAHRVERGAFRWRITIPDDGHLPGDGIVPTLIQWDVAQHPADAMPDAGVELSALAGAHPQPAAIRAALARLALGDTVKVTFSATPRLAAMLQTRRGTVTLTS
jgi:Glyoxalase-like domain